MIAEHFGLTLMLGKLRLMRISLDISKKQLTNLEQKLQQVAQLFRKEGSSAGLDEVQFQEFHIGIIVSEQIYEFLLDSSLKAPHCETECKNMKIQKLLSSNVIQNDDLKKIVYSKILSEEDINVVKRQIRQDKAAQKLYMSKCRSRLNKARMAFISGLLYMRVKYIIFNNVAKDPTTQAITLKETREQVALCTTEFTLYKLAKHQEKMEEMVAEFMDALLKKDVA